MHFLHSMMRAQAACDHPILFRSFAATLLLEAFPAMTVSSFFEIRLAFDMSI